MAGIERTVSEVRHPMQGIVAQTGMRMHRARTDLRHARKAMKAYAEQMGPEAVEQRRTQIFALQHKVWHSRVVFKLRCHKCGKVRWESEFVCWWLLDLKRHICSWCMGH